MAARYLGRAGLRVHREPTAAPALARLADGADAVAVLDLTMPGADLRQVRRALRAGAVPAVFLLTGPRPRGLGGAGRNRWITRPFGPRALVAAVQDLLGGAGQRGAGAGTGRASTGRATAGRGSAGRGSAGQGGAGQGAMAPAASGVAAVGLDQGRRLAVVAGREVPLTGSEFAMLAALAASPGRVLSRRRLLEAAGHGSATDRAADVHVVQLRAKIGCPGLIRTVRGAGYMIDSGGQ